MQENLIIGSKITRLKSVESTNKYLIGSIPANEFEEGIVVVTDEQYAGKGLGANKWESQAGKNLTFSFLIYPHFLSPADQFILNKFTSLAIADFIKQMIQKKKVSIKWPNDIYIGDRKASGILINNAIKGNSFEHSIIGIGVNINQETFKSDAPNPVSVKQVTGKEYDLQECLSILLNCLNRRYLQLINNEINRLNADYQNNLYRKDEFYYFRDNEQVFKGRIKGVTEFGKLIIKNPDGEQRDYDFKEVEFVY